MQLESDGAVRLPAAIPAADLAALDHLLDPPGRNSPGVRLGRLPGLPPLLRAVDAVACDLLGSAARPVKAVLFDKRPGRNWALGWHQDRTIAVRRRLDVPGFGEWTLKSGIHHVVPPFELLARTLTLRVHLDRVVPDNAPLLVVPGSHLLGRIAEVEIPAAVGRLGEHACLAERGDLWVYSTPILHRSQAAASPGRRRVLQLLYSAHALPGGLEWLGV